MKKINAFIQRILTQVIDFFYPLVRRFIPLQVYRYGVCGVGNLFFDWILYYVLYHYVFRAVNFSLGFVTLSPHIASLLVDFPITMLSGFWLGRYISFSGSDLGAPKQIKRYFLVVLVNVLIQYLGLKLCVDIFLWYPTPSKMGVTVINTLFSYLMQKHYTFKAPKPEQFNETL